MVGDYFWNRDGGTLSDEVKCCHLVQDFTFKLRGSIEVSVHGSHAESNDPGGAIYEKEFEDHERLTPCEVVE